MTFSQKIAASSPHGTLYCITDAGADLLDFYYLLLVPDSKRQRFERAIAAQPIRLADYGRLLAHGTGTPDAHAITHALANTNLQPQVPA